MILALWPLFIAMPESSNYALLDQRKRDERRLAKHRKQVEEELARRKNLGSNLQIERRSVADTGVSVSYQPVGIIADGLLGYGTDGVSDERGLPGLAGASITASDDVSPGIDEAMKRRNEEALILILANL